MKLPHRMFVCLVGLSCCLASAAPLPKDKEKEKEHEGKSIDSGSFGVFQNGHRVGTETFAIYQTGGGSTVQSEFKTENSPTTAVQTSELQLNANGEIRRYEWKEVSPDKVVSIVAPNSDFLNQKTSTDNGEKDQEQPYLLPTSTNILDDYFFIHRELLAWKYLVGDCKQVQGQMACTPKQRAQFGTMNPHQHSSAQISAEFLGRELVSLKSGPRELLKLELKSEAGPWELWLDDQFKVIRMSIVGENTVVERD